jgi:hypothetical protein
VNDIHWILKDLAVHHYSGKWASAVRFANRKKGVIRGSFDWYVAARQHFLELGGEYVHQLPAAQREIYRAQPEFGGGGGRGR